MEFCKTVKEFDCTKFEEGQLYYIHWHDINNNTIKAIYLCDRVDKEDNSGNLYIESDIENVVGIVNYDTGLLRLYNLAGTNTTATVAYTVNQNMTMNTDAIVVNENDSIVVRWVITLAAIGKNNIFSSYGGEESIVVPELGTHIIVK